MNNISFIRLVTALAALVVVTYIASALMLARKSESEPPLETAMPGTEGATSVIRNFQHIESYLENIGLEVSARKAELLEDRANLYGIRLRFYTPEQEVVSLRGEKGSIDLGTNVIFIEGNVRAVYNETYRFFSERVTWDPERQLLVSPGEVRILGPQGEVHGATLIAMPAKRRFIVREGVSVDFTGKSEEYLNWVPKLGEEPS